MKLKSLFTPLILGAVLLSGCSATPENQPEDKETIGKQREALAYDWFEKQTGLSSNDLIPPKKSIMARDYKTNLNAWYEPQVEAQIKSSLKALYDTIPDVNFEFRVQLGRQGACLPTKLLKRSVKEALPFLITPKKGNGSLREVMREMINNIFKGQAPTHQLKGNPYTLREVQMEYYYRAAIKLAYTMHNPEFASDYARGNIVSCEELQNLLSPLILAGASKSWNKKDAINSLKAGAIFRFEKVIAFNETSDRLYFILSSVPAFENVTPMYKSQAERLYFLQCNELDATRSYTYKDQFKARGNFRSWINKFAREEYGLSNVERQSLLRELDVHEAYKAVNGYQYVTENTSPSFYTWFDSKSGTSEVFKVQECWIPKPILLN